MCIEYLVEVVCYIVCCYRAVTHYKAVWFLFCYSSDYRLVYILVETSNQITVFNNKHLLSLYLSLLYLVQKRQVSFG